MRYFFIIVLFLFPAIVAGQSTPAEERLDPFEGSENTFQVKERDNLGIGIHAGTLFIQGDTRGVPSPALGFSLRKSIGHTFSLRYQGVVARAKGLDWRPSDTPEGGVMYRNYITPLTDQSVQLIASINNINFFRRTVKAAVYGFTGPGFMLYQTRKDLFNADEQPYSYDGFENPSEYSHRSDVVADLNLLFDDEYETTRQGGDPLGFGYGNAIIPRFSIVGGAGIGFRLSRRVDLNLEYRASWHNDDFLDGERRTRNQEISSTTDVVHFASAGLTFKVGKGVESRWWNNPISKPMESLGLMRTDINRLYIDGDKDGVLDFLDKEPDTKPGATVNTHGETVPDETDLINQLTKQLGDLTINVTNLNQQTQNRIDELEKKINKANDGYIAFGPVLFDYDKSKVKREFFPELIKAAQYIKARPAQSLRLTGYTDVRGSGPYNDKLAETRVQAVATFFTEYLGVSPSQIKIEYKGKNEPLLELPDQPYPNNDDAYYLNRRVMIDILK